MSSIQLAQSRSGGIRRTVEAEYSSAKGLTISVHELGDGATLVGDEYECWYQVSKRNMPAFCVEFDVDPTDVLGSLKRQYSGRNFAALEEAMKESRLIKFHSFF